MKAAERASELNEGKVPVRLNSRTVIYVHPDNVKFYSVKARKEEAEKSENREKVQFLKMRGWKMNKDGWWEVPKYVKTSTLLDACWTEGYYDNFRSPNVIKANRISHE